MPAFLLSATIRGVRSYGTTKEKTQTIDFMPLTLIVGQNGTGKTTVIESLKFIISGEEPPHSDSRRNFIHTPKNESQSRKSSNKPASSHALIEIAFKNANGESCIAKREISQPVKTATPAVLSSYKIGKGAWVNVHKQEDWNQIMPELFGLQNQAILSNVILCHQEDNLWCMADSNSVKQIFDKIFGCEQYKKEVKHMDDEMRNTKKDIQLFEKDLQRAHEHVDRKQVVVGEISKLEEEFTKLEENSRDLDKDLSKLSENKKVLKDQIHESEARTREASSLKQRLRELQERDALLRRSLQPLIEPRREKPTRKPLPPPQPIKRLKPDLDPTVDDLTRIYEMLERMTITMGTMPDSKEVQTLKQLVKNAQNRIELLRRRFCPDKMNDQIVEPAVIENEETEDEEAQRMEQEVRERKYLETIETSINENMKQLDELRDSIDKIEQQVRDNDYILKLESELRVIEKEIDEMRHQRSMILGSKAQMERELSRMQSELKSYKNINRTYVRCMGKLVCHKIILRDLEKLKTCFLESITIFHDQMIIKINEVLRARWRQIYQGTDIDHIELVDEEITRAKDKKSYNYHMAMHKGGIRMRMREKSSAGQRALASIILRMTLAELFVKEFAFIALDEPTANLDLANVQSLAKAIGGYVRRRTRSNANIQWIIITHDEQFLRALDEESSPFFYRIGIDEEGYSKISKISYSCVNELLP